MKNLSKLGQRQKDSMMVAFISHTTGEAPIALVLKESLEAAFDGHLKVFVSCDVHDLTPGKKWLRRIEEALKKSRILLVICSPSSLTRPWINFEAGCGWMRGMDIVPICHSEQHKDQLPHPFSLLQSLQLEDEGFCRSLITVFSTALGIPVPAVDLSRMRKKLERAKRLVHSTEVQPQVINSERDRTKLINDDLRTLLGTPRVAQGTVWASAFLSTFAIGADDPYPDTDKDYLKLLLQEKDLLLELAQKGCTIKCIISPANKNYIRHAGIEYARKRTKRLLDFIRSNHRALQSIDWAVSELGLRNSYIIGRISCFEGYKTGPHHGYGLTLRQTSPDIIKANLSLHTDYFRDLAAHTLSKWCTDCDSGGERLLLRTATARCLEESIHFLEGFGSGG